MSAINKTPVKLVDGRIAYESEKAVPCLDAPIEVSYVQFQAQSTNSNKLIFNINIPSLDTGVNRSLTYHLQGIANVTGTSTSGNLVDGLTFGLSDNCADQLISVETAKVGSKEVSVDRSLVGVELDRLNVDSKTSTLFRSGQASLQDFSVDFRPWVNTNRDVLGAPYDVNASDSVPSTRTCNVWQEVPLTNPTPTTQTATNAYYKFDIYFKSKCAPFNEDAGDTPAIRNLDNVLLTLQLENIGRLFSMRINDTAVNTVTSIGLFGNQFSVAEVLCQFLTPSAYSLMISSPLNDVYNYNEIQEWVTSALSVDVANRKDFTMNLQQLSGSTIPDFIIIGARPVVSLLGENAYRQPRYWFPPADNAFNLKFNNTSFNNGMTQRDIYEQTLRNGLSQVPFEQFRGQNVSQDRTTSIEVADNLVLGGSFCILNPARDCHIIQKGLTNGTEASWTLSGSMQFINPFYGLQDGGALSPIQVEMFVIVMYAGILSSTGKVYGQTSLLSKSEVIDSLMSATRPISDANAGVMAATNEGYSGSALLGGRKGGNFVDVIKKIYEVGKPIAEFAYKNRDEIASGAKTIHKALGKRGKGGALLGGGSYQDYEANPMRGGASLDTSNKAIQNKRALVREYLNK